MDFARNFSPNRFPEDQNRVSEGSKLQFKAKVGRRKRTENAFAKLMQRKRAAEVAQEGAKNANNIRSGKQVGSPRYDKNCKRRAGAPRYPLQ